MQDSHYVDRDVRKMLDMLAASYGDYANMSVADIRERFAAHARATAQPLPEGCAEGYVDIQGPGGVIPCRYFLPENMTGPIPAIIHFLSGTFVATSLEQVGRTPVELSRATASLVITPLHRMPPEHRYPAAYDDCFAVYRWVLERGAEIGIDPGRVVLFGESSGGTLAASVCLKAREAGLPQPKLMVLAEPLLDHESETPSMNEFTYVLSKEMLRAPDSMYFGTERPPVEASPLRAASLADIAPAYVITAGLDPLRDEALAFVARLRREGVFVAHRHHDGQVHGFFSMFEQLKHAQLALAECCAAVRVAFAGRLDP
jgi:acetyl esterase